jgi:hypothetical protein
MGKLSQRQIVATIVPSANRNIEAPPPMGPDQGQSYFAQVSGGEITASVEKIYVGGRLFPETLCAPSEIGDITVTRHYDRGVDGSFLRGVRQLVGRAYYDVTVKELNCDIADPQSVRVYPQCLLVGLTEPEGDASSGAPATYSLTFSVSTVATSAV